VPPRRRKNQGKTIGKVFGHFRFGKGGSIASFVGWKEDNGSSLATVEKKSRRKGECNSLTETGFASCGRRRESPLGIMIRALVWGVPLLHHDRTRIKKGGAAVLPGEADVDVLEKGGEACALPTGKDSQLA